MPMDSSSASSTAHCESVPGRPVCPPTSSARAFIGAYRPMPTVVSISLKPRNPASAASAASRAGVSLTLVTCAWLAGVRRGRSFCIAIISSTTFIRLRTSRILAGVMPGERRAISERGTFTSTSIRAMSLESMAIASSATETSMQ